MMLFCATIICWIVINAALQRIVIIYAILSAVKTKNVIVAFTIGSIAGRNCLSGVFDFVNAGHPWKIRYMQDPDELTPDVVKHALGDGIDGVITGFRERTEGMAALENAPIPVVFTDYPRSEAPDGSRHNFLIRNDDIAIGREGARHLLSRGTFRSYAFIPTTAPTRWSTLRERGFRLQVAESGQMPRRFHPQNDDLVRFLSELPRPAAVMAATDYMAVQVIEACRAAKISIPEQLAVIGVDNDELLCNASRPTLTSIKPDHEGLGHLGAKILDCMMAGRNIPKNIPSRVKSLGVVERDSTKVVPPAGYIVREALAFIRSNAAKGIDVDDVVRHIGVSRRLLYLRFRQMNGKSIHETILDTRLALAKRKLAQTTAPLAQIASECGFGSANHLSHVFHNRFGIYPSASRTKT